jgi:hypothetical protein
MEIGGIFTNETVPEHLTTVEEGRNEVNERKECAEEPKCFEVKKVPHAL